MPSLCSKCSKNVTDKRFPGLSCANCNKIYHISCANIQKESFDSIAKNQLAWSCSACKKKPSTRRSGIFPPTGPSLVQSTLPTNDDLLKNLISEFNSYKESTNVRIAQLENLLAVKTQQVSSLTESIKRVEVKAEEIVQLSTANCLEIQGVPQGNLNSPTESVLFIAEEIGCALTSENFDCSISQNSSKPVIAIKFNSTESRRSFLHAGKKFNRDKKRVKFGNQEYKIFVNEQLTPIQKKLLYDTKTFARERRFNYAWFCNGLVHLKKREDSELIYIRSQDDLDILGNNEAQILLPEREGSQIQDERGSPRRQIQRL